MDTKEIEITCPCCASRLLVDVRTAAVLRSTEPGETAPEKAREPGEAGWSRAHARVRERTDGGEGRLDEALRRERDKGSKLDELFRKANDKLGQPGEPHQD